MADPRPRTIVSVTTVPWRVDHLATVLRSLLSQSTRGFEIRVYVPPTCSRTGERYVLPEGLLRVLEAEPRVSLSPIATDYGPATKFLAPLVEGLNEEWPADTRVVTVDDDIILEPHAVEELLEASARHPDDALGFMGILGKEFVHAEELAAQRVSGREVQVLGGYRSILYPLRVLDRSLLADHAALTANGAPFADDDHLVAWNLARRGVARRVIATRYPGPDFTLNFRLLNLPGPLTVEGDGGPATADARRRLVAYYRSNDWTTPGTAPSVPGRVSDGARRAPMISVFTGSCDIGAGIRRPYESLLRQTNPNWEWVVVDDSESRETAGLVTELARASATAGRIRLERHAAPSRSIGATKADAAALARGELLVELDHDDELMPDALSTVAAAFAVEPPVDFVYSDFVDLIDAAAPYPGLYPDGWGFELGAYASEMIGGRRLPVGLAPPITWETIRHIVAAPNHLRAWRTDFYRRIGGHNRELPVADDYELVVRSFLEGSCARIPRPLYVQYHHPAGLNASRRLNPDIQRLVGEVATRYEHEIDRRCLSYGLTPSVGRPAPWVDAGVIAMGNRVIDPVADVDAARGQPLVSVVVPTHRRPYLLARAIESALSQTYGNLEVLVVGDGCPDVDGVLSSITDARVRHWNLGRHFGDSGAAPRNYALKAMARGAFVAYLDDDNTWREDHVETLMAMLEENRAATYALSSFDLGNETIICRRPRRYQVDTSAILHRRFLLDRFGYWASPESVGYAHDWELVSRWAGEPWHVSLEPTLSYNLTSSTRHPAVVEHIRAVADEERRASLTSKSGP